jgi:hypothetical protein
MGLSSKPQGPGWFPPSAPAFTCEDEKMNYWETGSPSLAIGYGKSKNGQKNPRHHPPGQKNRGIGVSGPGMEELDRFWRPAYKMWKKLMSFAFT